MKYIVDCTTGEEFTTEMNDEELAQEKREQEVLDAINAERLKAAKEAAAAKAVLLDKLGITEEEAKLLLS